MLSGTDILVVLHVTNYACMHAQKISCVMHVHVHVHCICDQVITCMSSVCGLNRAHHATPIVGMPPVDSLETSYSTPFCIVFECGSLITCTILQ